MVPGNSHTHPRQLRGGKGGGEGSKAKVLKESMELNWDFQKVGRGSSNKHLLLNVMSTLR